MKKHMFVLLACLLALHLVSSAQQTEQEPLQLSHNKTTSLIFPFAIKSVDRGSAALLAQVPRETQNVLQVKAAVRDFPATNLTVITAGGRLYSFPVQYAADPDQTVINLSPPLRPRAPVQLAGIPLNEAQLQVISRQLEGDKRWFHGIQDKAGGVKATLAGIYSYQDLLFYRIVLSNRSSLPYHLDFIQSHTRSRRHFKLTAYQQQEVPPLYVYGMTGKSIPASSSRILIVAIRKGSLSPQNKLIISLPEQQGGRHLELQVRGRHIRQAIPLQLEKLY